jgi:hypothetical protein
MSRMPGPRSASMRSVRRAPARPRRPGGRRGDGASHRGLRIRGSGSRACSRPQARVRPGGGHTSRGRHVPISPGRGSPRAGDHVGSGTPARVSNSRVRPCPPPRGGRCEPPRAAAVEAARQGETGRGSKRSECRRAAQEPAWGLRGSAVLRPHRARGRSHYHGGHRIRLRPRPHGRRSGLGGVAGGVPKVVTAGKEGSWRARPCGPSPSRLLVRTA